MEERPAAVFQTLFYLKSSALVFYFFFFQPTHKWQIYSPPQLRALIRANSPGADYFFFFRKMHTSAGIRRRHKMETSSAARVRRTGVCLQAFTDGNC